MTTPETSSFESRSQGHGVRARRLRRRIRARCSGQSLHVWALRSRRMGLRQPACIVRRLVLGIDPDAEGESPRPRRHESLRLPDRRSGGNRFRSGLRLRSRCRYDQLELPGDRPSAGRDEATDSTAPGLPAPAAQLQAQATVEGVSSASESSVTSARASASFPGR